MQHARIWLTSFVLLLACSCERTPDARPAAALPSAVPVGQPSAAPVPSAAPSAVSPAPVASVEVDAGRVEEAPEANPRLPQKRSDRSASSARKTRDGTLFIAGQDRSARHTHGGAPAHVGNVTFVVTNDSNRVRRITAKSVDFLRDKGCEAPASTVVSHPKLEGLVPEADDDPRTPTLTLEIPPNGSLAVRVGFASVEAYYAWCDRFAIRVFFSVDGNETLGVVSELAVMRVEPVR